MKLKNTFKLGMLMILSLASSLAIAQKTPHTWHTVRSTNGNWTAQLAMISEPGWFVTRKGEGVSTFSVSPANSFDYGFGFDAGADFDIAYTLTLTQNSSAIGFVSKACVYLITASGPAKPDIRATSYNGATCDWNVVHGVGEDFTVG